MRPLRRRERHLPARAKPRKSPAGTELPFLRGTEKCGLSPPRKSLMNLPQSKPATEDGVAKFQQIPIRDEPKPTDQQIDDQGSLVAGWDVNGNPLALHSHQHPKRRLGWLILMLPLVGLDVWSQPASAKKEDSVSQKLLVVVQDLQEVRSGQRQVGRIRFGEYPDGPCVCGVGKEARVADRHAGTRASQLCEAAVAGPRHL